MAFTTDNTADFSADELDVLNEALKTLSWCYPLVDEKNLHDMLNNHFIDGVTTDELIARCQLDLGAIEEADAVDGVRGRDDQER